MKYNFFYFPLSSESNSAKFKMMAWGFTTLCQYQEFHRQRISKNINDPNGSIGQLDLIRIYRIIHPRTSVTIILRSYVTDTKTDPISNAKHSTNGKV